MHHRKLTRLLRDWGNWRAGVILDAGYREDDTMAEYVASEAGHRILCADTPLELVPVCHAIAKLDRRPGRVVFLKYVFDRWPTGVEVTDRDRAKILKMGPKKFDSHLSRSRSKIKNRLMYYEKTKAYESEGSELPVGW